MMDLDSDSAWDMKSACSLLEAVRGTHLIACQEVRVINMARESDLTTTGICRDSVC
jgi:hypothetical protein